MFYDYEPDWEPEFVFDFPATLGNISDSADYARNHGFKAGSAPTGRAIGNADLKKYGWNYGQIANSVDAMIVQLQARLRVDYLAKDRAIPNFKYFAHKLMLQQVGAGSTADVFPQVTLLTDGSGMPKNPNGSSTEFCIEGIKALQQEGFSGVSLWYSSAASDIGEVIKIMQAFRDPH